MSKVRAYLDTKIKARHRVRRQETRAKKFSRYRNHKKAVYKWYKSGYSPILRDREAWRETYEVDLVNDHGYLKRFGCTKILKYCKRQTRRAVRRQKNFEDEDYMLPVRNDYKRNFDLDSWLW